VNALPRSLAGDFYRPLRGAVGNARSAALALTRSNDQRRALQPVESDGSQSPGTITRLPRSECLRLLAEHSLGRLAYVARAGTPDIVPVNYVLRSEDTIVIRTGPGPKLASAERGDRVAFEVDDIDRRTRTGWSVVVTGRARRLSPNEVAACHSPQPWATGPRRQVLQITIDRVAGRRLS
jgi:uncharacterized protein